MSATATAQPPVPPQFWEGLDMRRVVKFNFTWAGGGGGAWLEDAAGNRRWVPYGRIVQHLGSHWWDRQIQRQGWMTGCWIEVAR